ncbi:MAG TPA: S1C family serine protease [Terriglobia bacterium]|nr:S1C family serine protease [Terriglobia bacterium]
MSDTQRNLLQELSNSAAAAVERASAAVVAVNARRHALVSGVHWREGLIVTANHAVRREDDITILLPDGRTAPATLAGRDPSTDLALLKVEGAGFSLPDVGDPSKLKVGNLVLAVGRVETGPRANLGVIGLRGGPWKTWVGGQVDQLIRLGFELHPTLSGGLLSDVEGRCLGINTHGLSRSYGVAIPPATVNRVIDILLQKGRIPQGYLGVGLVPVAIPPSMQSKLGLPEDRGLMVQYAESGGPAARAGMLLGDVLVRFNNAAVTSIHQLHSLLAPEVIGAHVKATVIRAGALTGLDIPVEERPR